MFGFSNLLYARDSLQGLQIQQRPLADGQASSGNGSQRYLVNSELLGPEYGGQNRGNVVVENSPAKLNLSLTAVPLTPDTRTNPPLAILENNLGHKNVPFRKSRELPQHSKLLSQPHLISRSLFASPPQVNAGYPGCHYYPGTQNILLTDFQQHKVKHDWDPRDLGERLIESSATRDLIQERPAPHRLVSPLLPPIANLEQTSSPVAPTASKFQRMSTLQESNGNSQHLSDIEQPEIIVRKTHKSSKIVLQSSKPSDSIYQLSVRKSSLKLFLSPKSSFAEDYTYGTTFLGRYRTPSTPEPRVPESPGPLFQLQPLPRSSSLTSLKHLPPDKKRDLYIGIKNRKLFLPYNSDRSLKSLDVTYQVPRLKQRKTATMTPLEVLSPPKLCIKCALSHTVGVDHNQFDLIRKCLGPPRHNSSVVANAGSEDSASVQVFGVPQKDQMAAPAASFDFEVTANHFQSEYLRTLDKHAIGKGDQESRIGKLKTIDPTQSKTIDDSDELSDETSEDLIDFKLDSTRSKTADVSNEPIGNLIQFDGASHDREFACWNPKYARVTGCTQDPCPTCAESDGELEISQPAASGSQSASPVSPGRVQNRAQDCVSFAQSTVEKPTNRKSVTYRRSTSINNPITPSPLISPRFRGSSFSKEFKENMMTLPMSPVDHSVPFAGLRSSNTSGEGSAARSIISLSGKPKGFWAKLKDAFKGCLDAY